jgi:beta-lactamase regulating signal transducer with metallopeptidase domain
MGLIAAEVAVLVAVAALVHHLLRSPAGRRALWQACVLGVLVLLSAELSGLGRDLTGSPTARAKPPTQSGSGAASIANRQSPIANQIGVPERSTRQAVNAETAASDPSSPRALQLRDGFRQQVAERVAGNRGNRGAEPVTPGEAAREARPATLPAPPASMDHPELTWIGLAWVVGAGLLMLRVFTARLLSAWFRLRSRSVTDCRLATVAEALAVRLGLRTSLSLKESARLRGPIAFGVFRPTIILPAGFARRFTAAQQDAMLAHEIAHLAARDPLWHLLADLAAALLWWHPLVWWARHRLHVANEAAADLASLLVADGPQVLAECLVELGNRLTQSEALGWLGVTGFRSQLGRRVEQLLSLHHGEWRPLDRWRSALAKVLGALAVVALTLFATAWALPQSVTQGDDMRTIRQSWKQSLAAFALLASASLEQGVAAESTSGTQPAPPASGSSLGATEARESSGIEIEAKETKLNRETGEFMARGSVRLRSRTFELSTGEIHGNLRTGTIRPNGETRVRFFAKASGSESLVPSESIRFRQNDTGGELAASDRVFQVRAESGAVDQATDMVRLNVVSLKSGETELTADTATLNPKERELTASGNVQLKVTPNSINLPQPDPGTMERYGLVPQATASAPAPAVQPAPPAPAAVPAAQRAPQMDPRMMERYGIQPSDGAAAPADNKSSAEENRRRMMLRYGLEPRSPAGTPAAAGRSEGIQSGAGYGSGFGGGGGGMVGGPLKSSSALEGRLEQIQFDEVVFDGIPLPEVLHYLNEESRARDPEKKGVNLLINPNSPPLRPPSPLVDPTTGQLIPAPSPEPTDMNNVLIRFNLPLRDVRLKDVLDAVVRVADWPIQYSMEDYGVVFSAKSAQEDLETRVFKVDPNAFAEGLRDMGFTAAGTVTPGSTSSAGQPIATTPDPPRTAQDTVRAFFRAAGFDINPPNQMFFNDRRGLLMVRASSSELDHVQKAIEVLNVTSPQLTIEAKLVEITQGDVKALGFDWFMGNRLGGQGSPIPAVATNLTGILTEPQVRLVLKALEQRDGVKVLATPRVTTLSGRQMQLQIDGVLSLDVLPLVSADGYSIQMTVIASLDTADRSATATKLSRISTSAVVWDGQTVVLGGLQKTEPFRSGNAPGEARKNVMLLITPTIIDPAGNRVHTADNLPYDPSFVPPQIPPNNASSNVLK